MIIAVTGATGSIGKELTPFLHGLGHQLITISSSIISDGKKNFSYDDLENKKIPFKVDLFVHLASFNAALKKENIDQEVEITKKVLFSLSSLSCKKLIFFSTSKVYGANSIDANSFNESSDLEPSCNYGIAKKLCEELIRSQSYLPNLKALILRLPPVLNGSKTSNIGKLMSLSRKRVLIPTLAQGEINQRSFISSNNIKILFEHILSNTHLLEENKTYNLSDSKFISLNEMLRASGKSTIFCIPAFVGKILFHVPILKNVLIQLYGNFVLDNTRLSEEMGVKLETTSKSLPIIFK
jgi:nucleoside-diphosphate-sugar epimerase